MNTGEERFKIISTPGSEDPSAISIISMDVCISEKKEEILVNLYGPMSMFAAGAFIESLIKDEEKIMD